jgi:hypothetical protein
MTNEMFFGAIVLVNIICSIIIIRHKNTIIKDFQAVMQSTDIKRLADYYSKMDELKKADLLHAKKAIVRTLDESLQEHYNKIGRQYDEMAMFIESLYSSLPEKERAGFIDRHLPTCVGMFPFNNEETEVGSSRK